MHKTELAKKFLDYGFSYALFIDKKLLLFTFKLIYSGLCCISKAS